MREPNPAMLHLVNGDIESLIAHNRSLYGDAVMTADPAAAAPPAAFDPQTGEPIAQPPAPAPATDPAGVWGQGVVPPAGIQTVPAPTQQPPAAPQPPAGQPYVEIEGRRYYTEEFLETARTQERDKMHGRLETIESELQQQRQEREERERQIREEAEQKAREEEAARLAGLSVEDRIVELQKSWEDRWNQRNEADARRDALDAQERRYNELMSYRDRRIAEESALIHPTLVDLVASPDTGASSEQQIEESIAAMKARTDAIVGTVRQEQIDIRRQMPGVAPTGQPPAPVDQTSGYQTISPADIAAMDPATYAKNRPLLMAAMQRTVAERGLYGG